MTQKTCAHCGGAFQAEADRPPAFCPFCGMALERPAARQSSDFAAALRLKKMPKDKYKFIMEALSKNPDDFEANEALLHHGRVHEALSGRGLDYSAIPCHLLSVFEKPQEYSESEREQKLEELLHGPQLVKTMRLSENPDAYFIEYLNKMAFDYINLFIHGDSRNTKMAFGFGRTRASTAKACALPVRRMLSSIEAESRLEDDARNILRRAVTKGYASLFSEHTDLLFE